MELLADVFVAILAAAGPLILVEVIATAFDRAEERRESALYREAEAISRFTRPRGGG